MVCPWHTVVVAAAVATSGFTETARLRTQPVGRVYIIFKVGALATPVTMPVPVPTVASPLLELLQAPPERLLLKVMVCPTQTVVGPVTGAVGFTVIDLEVTQPAVVT